MKKNFPNLENLERYIKEHGTRIVNGYRALCQILNVKEATAGRSRKIQKELFSTLFEWKKIEGSQKIIIGKIYDVEDREVCISSKKGVYRQNLYKLILYLLKENEQYYGTCNSLTFQFGYKQKAFKDFCNAYNSLERSNNLYTTNKLDFKDAKLNSAIRQERFFETVVDDFVNRVNHNSKNTLNSALKDLVKDGIISNKPAYSLNYKMNDEKDNKYKSVVVYICPGKTEREYESVDEFLKECSITYDKDSKRPDPIIFKSGKFYSKIKHIENKSMLEVQEVFCKKYKNQNVVLKTINDLYRYKMFDEYQKIFSDHLIKQGFPQYAYKACIIKPIRDIVNNITTEEVTKAIKNINDAFCQSLINSARKQFFKNPINIGELIDATESSKEKIEQKLAESRIWVYRCYPKESLRQYKILVDKLLRMDVDMSVVNPPEDNCLNDELIA